MDKTQDKNAKDPEFEELTRKTENWIRNGEFEQALQVLGPLAHEERSPFLDLCLSIALCNTSKGWQDREKYTRALDLLMPLEGFLHNDFFWNLQAAQALKGLEQWERALPYFVKANELRPQDADSYDYDIDFCKEQRGKAQFTETFRERVGKAWQKFEQEEGAFVARFSEESDDVCGDVAEWFHKVLGQAIDSHAFSVRRKNNKFEVVLSPDGRRPMLFELFYFVDHAPAHILKNWNFVLGRQPNPDFSLRSPTGEKVAIDDVRIWVEPLDIGPSLKVYAYCKKLPANLEKPNDWFIKHYWLLVNSIGEIAAMENIALEAIPKPLKGKGRSQPLSKLSEIMKQRGLSLDLNPAKALCSVYNFNKKDPKTEEGMPLRSEITKLVSRCLEFPVGFLQRKTSFFEALQADGAVPGFIMFFNYPFKGEDKDHELEEFHEALHAAIQDTGPDAVTVFGYASGPYAGYVDFIAWDLPAVLKAAKDFLQKANKTEALFHAFHYDGGIVDLYNGPDEEEKVDPTAFPDDPKKIQ